MQDFIRQQSTGVQPWSWAIAWRICGITNWWRETAFVFMVLHLEVFSFFLLCRPADLFWLHSFCAAIPPCKPSLTTCSSFVNTLQGKICQMQMTLQLKPCKSQQVLLAGIYACIVAFWVWFAWIHASWATASDKTSKPTPNLPFYSGFTVKPP